MYKPGALNLTQRNGQTSLPLTVAGTFDCDVVEDIQGALGLTVFAKHDAGVGASGSAKAYVQTRFGGTWVDIACLAFGSSSEVAGHALSFLTPRTLFSILDGGLTDDTINDGVIGDALRARIVVAGSFPAGAQLTLTGQIR